MRVSIDRATDEGYNHAGTDFRGTKMTTLELVTQIQSLDQRLAQVEATLLRLEQLMQSQLAAQFAEPAHRPTGLRKPIRFVSTRLRRREQAADFNMTVTHNPTDARL